MIALGAVLFRSRARWPGWLLAWCLSALSWGTLGAVSVVRGPEVAATATNAVVRWTTDVEAGSRVQFGLSLGRMDRRAQGEVGIEHQVELTGLQPGTTYHYTVGTSRLPLATNQFTTLGKTSAQQPSPTKVPSTNASSGGNVPKTDSAPPRPPPTRVTWGSLRSLPDHFARHGRDFAAKNEDDYAAQAWLFLVKAKADGFPAKRDADGVVRVFDPKTGAFAAYNKDGTTKTYFKPGRRGYFEDQPGQTVDLRKLNDFQPPR